MEKRKSPTSFVYDIEPLINKRIRSLEKAIDRALTTSSDLVYVQELLELKRALNERIEEELYYSVLEWASENKQDNNK